MASAPVDHSALPSVRQAQGELIKAIFSHPAFDDEGDRMYGKLFYVFEETVGANDSLELAHLGDDADAAVLSALTRSIDITTLICDGDPDGTLLKGARSKYVDRAPGREAIEDVDLGDAVRSRAGAVRDAAQKVLGR